MKKNGLLKGIEEMYKEEYEEIGKDITTQDMEVLAFAVAIRTDKYFKAQH